MAVLTGANGTFCAGADLKAMQEPGAPQGESRRARRRRPGRPNPDAPGQAGDRRRRGSRGRRRAGARRLVRPAGRGRGCGVRRLLPPLGHPADGRRHHSARPAARPQPCPGPDPHGPGRPRRGGAANGPRQPAGSSRRVAWPPPSSSPASSPPGPRRRCAATASPHTSSGRCRSTRPCRGEYEHGMSALRTGELFSGLDRYASGEWR